MECEFLKDKEMIKKFCKDYSLPIRIYDEKYISYFLNLYKDHFELEQKLKNFEEAYLLLGKEGTQKEWHRIKDTVIEKVKLTEVYKKLENEKIDANLMELHKKDPYSDFGESYIMASIDIRKANFNALKYYSKDLVLGYASYEELLEKEAQVNLNYFKEIKILRQLIFEQFNPKKQSTIQKKVIQETVKELLEKIRPIHAFVIGTDEVAFYFSKEDNSIEKVQEEMNSVFSSLKNKDILKLDVFTVKRIGKEFFLKESFNGKKSLKKVPSSVYPQVFKKVFGGEIEENDLLFVDSQTGLLSRYLKSIFINLS